MTSDCIIVGQGLAGSILAYSMMEQGFSVIVMDDGHNHSSSVAAGIYNPVTGRRFVKTWQADKLFPYLENFYSSVQLKSGVQILNSLPIYRPFNTRQAQETWVTSDRETLRNHYIHTIETIPYLPEIINNPYGGLVFEKGGYVNIKNFLHYMQAYLTRHGCYTREKFDESRIIIKDDSVRYKDLTAGRLIFCDGYRVSENKLFSWLPFRPVKGEIITIEAEPVPGRIIIHGVFMLPLDNNLMRIGATYNREDINNLPTAGAKIFIENKLKHVLNVKFKTVDHVAGIRPATRDRRPVIGLHPENKRIGIFNGFGSKGVSLIPYFAGMFINHLFKGGELDRETDIIRFFI